MKIDELIILAFHFSDSGMIAGRTLLQKTLYFINEKLQFGLEFTPYYYGPYSVKITETTDSLGASGIIEEKVESLSPLNFNVAFEPRRYVYILTKTGKKIADLIKKRYPQEAKEIEQVIEEMKNLGKCHDYKNLSIAAKMHHILKVERRSMTPQTILKEASALDWRIKMKEAEEAIDFLQELKLIET